ncbi:hypothetical protein ACP6EK_00400 [Candidatus Caldatribacterium sp. SIUC1]|uniref:hypothetical protein n=1 Tax=Candidatus Caldatribacterium sp. SIUC1 TaxID=3418365 RepID=UPI003F68C674
MAFGGILVEARTLAVADVVEAMTYYRPYRSALELQETLREIAPGRGVFYDEAAFDACLRIFQEKRFTFED